MTLNNLVPDPNHAEHFLWAALAAVGINGRGVKRAGVARIVGGRSMTPGEDVTNQASDTTKG